MLSAACASAHTSQPPPPALPARAEYPARLGATDSGVPLGTRDWRTPLRVGTSCSREYLPWHPGWDARPSRATPHGAIAWRVNHRAQLSDRRPDAAHHLRTVPTRRAPPDEAYFITPPAHAIRA